MRRVAVLAEATIGLMVASLLVRVLSSPSTTRLLGRPAPRDAVDPQLPGADLRHALYLGRVVERAAERLPWHPVCLPQALALRGMLRWRRIASTAHLGVTATSPIEGHAWITAGGQVLHGGPVGQVTELGRFA